MANTTGRKYGGRQKGTPNKKTAELKDMINNALSKVGGEDYLVEQAINNPSAFMTLLGKILPKDIKMQATVKNVKEMTDDQLYEIAAGGSTGNN